MSKLRWLPRLSIVLWVICRYRLIELIPANASSFAIRLLRGLSALTPLSSDCKKQPVELRLRLALERLGPIYVKFGQLLSTRRDMLPERMANELALLQDQVPPFSSAEAQRIIEAELGYSISELFSRFDSEPLAQHRND